MTLDFMRTREELASQVGQFNSILGLATAMSHAGIFLLLFRYKVTGAKHDLILCLLLSALTVSLLIPTGWRGTALSFIPWLFLLYAIGKRDKKKVLVILTVLVFTLSALSAAVQSFRDVGDQSGKPILARLGEITDALVEPSAASSIQVSTFEMMAGRLAEYQVPGRIIEYSPEVIPYRGAEGLENIPLMFVPKIIFTDRMPFLDFAIISERYGVGKVWGGSSPVMIIGDLFSRWGWAGLILGMGVLGFVLTWLDKLVLTEWNTQSILFFALFCERIYKIANMSLFDLIVFLSRELALAWILSIVISKIFLALSANGRSSYLRDRRPLGASFG